MMNISVCGEWDDITRYQKVRPILCNCMMNLCQCTKAELVKFGLRKKHPEIGEMNRHDGSIAPSTN